ncbi:hypothetical protein [Kordia jejudonensis]|uniref:hypothetical protein n=1 Tax=Kordia jejudonensis TaxID=1348245 RepID=UPI0006290720|nr:hypothetical protein [Kordia jejudonensis]
MKKSSLKSLRLNKKSISSLNLQETIKGGISGYHYLCSSLDCAGTEHAPSESGSELIDCWGTTVLTYGNRTCDDSL